MKNTSATFLCLLLIVLSKAQIVEININENMTRDSVNTILTASDLPFFLSEVDSMGQQWMTHCDSLYGNIQLFSFFDNLVYVAKFQNDGRNFYLFLFYAYAGYDYFYLWSENKKMLYISDKFNFEQDDGYDFLFNSFNLDNFSISARQRSYNDLWAIHFKPLEKN